jgi:hypothetical protein
MTPSESPPPYTPRDPLVSPSPERRTSPEPGEDPTRSSVSLRGGYLRAIPRESDPVLSPTAYFEERNFDSEQIPSLMVLDVDIHPGTKRDELPFPLSQQDREARNITNQDWDTFVNYLLTELGSDEISGESEKGRRWGTMTPEEFFQAKLKMENIVGEWNEAFFMPRGIHFNAKFSFAAPTAPSSSQPVPQESTPAAVPAYAEAPLPDESNRSIEQPPQPEHYGHPWMMPGRGMHPAMFMGPRGRGMHGGPFMPHGGPFIAHPFLAHQLAAGRGMGGGPFGRGRQLGRGAHGPGRGHHRNHRSRSSSSSSSSSSISSVSSLSASSIANTDAAQVRDAIATFRLDPTRKSHLKMAVNALHKDLRQKHKELRRTPSSCSRENKKDYKENKRAIKEQLRGLKDEIHSMKKERKNERRTQKQARKAAKKAAKEQRKAERRGGSRTSYTDDATLVGDTHTGQERGFTSVEDEDLTTPQPDAQSLNTTVSRSDSNATESPRLATLSKADRKLEIKARQHDAQAEHWERQAQHWQHQIDHYMQVYAHHDVQRRYQDERRAALIGGAPESPNPDKAEKLAEKRAKQLQKSQQARDKHMAKAEVVRQKLAQQRVKAEQMAVSARKQAAETRARMEYQAVSGDWESTRSGPGNALGSYFENMGKRIETWGEHFGRDMEAWGEQFGKDMEAWGHRVEQMGEGRGQGRGR